MHLKHAQHLHLWFISCAIACANCTTPALAFTASSPEQAPQPQTLDKVVVKGSGEQAQRQEAFLAGKRIISRRQIEASSAQHALELLRRDPVVTVSADGRIGLLGLPGYTQILVDGQPPTAGKALAELPLERIERVEIVKSALAEVGPFGIGGTINVITRSVPTTPEQSVRFSTGGGAAEQSNSASWTRSDVLMPDRLRARWNASGGRKQSDFMDVVNWSGVNAPTGEARHQSRLSKHLLVGGTLDWQPSEREELEVGLNFNHLRTTDRHRWRTEGSAADVAALRNDWRNYGFEMPVNWSLRDSNKHQWTLRARTGSNQSLQRVEQKAVSVTPVSEVTANVRDRWRIDSLDVTFEPSLPASHGMKVGLEWQAVRERRSYDERTDGTLDRALQDLYGNQSSQKQATRAGFFQYDWRVSARLALNAGLRLHVNDLRLQEGESVIKAPWRLWAPSGHAAWKLDPLGSQRLRLSLARTFKKPERDQLSQRPRFDTEAPCPRFDACPSNPVDHPDLVGNPDLQPERALGANLSWESDLESTGMVSIELFARQLSAVIGEEIDRRAVPWSNQMRNVKRPVNLGQAWTRGLGFDISAPIQSRWAGGSRLTVTAGLQLAWSRLDTLPGPDNRLADQRPWSVKLGVSYKAKSLPVDWSANWSTQPGAWTRVSANRAIYAAHTSDLSADAAWTLNRSTKLRFGLRKLLARPSLSAELFESSDGSLLRSVRRSEHVSAVVRLEAKL
jgi:outer membrane receptor for ferrienterochelin and colicin